MLDTDGHEDQELLRFDDAAKLSTLGVSTLRRLVAQGELPALKIGRRVRIRRADLRAWLADFSKPARPAAA